MLMVQKQGVAALYVCGLLGLGSDFCILHSQAHLENFKLRREPVPGLPFFN